MNCPKAARRSRFRFRVRLCEGAHDALTTPPTIDDFRTPRATARSAACSSSMTTRRPRVDGRHPAPRRAPRRYAGQRRRSAAEAGRRKFRRHLTDLQMPGMNGLEFMSALKRGRTGPRSSWSRPTHRYHGRRGDAPRAFDYIEKPFSLEQLEDLVTPGADARSDARSTASRPFATAPTTAFARAETARRCSRFARGSPKSAPTERNGADPRRKRHGQGARRAEPAPVERRATRGRS